MEIRFVRERRRVLTFSVQYLAEISGEWHPVVRFDTAHGVPHMDVLWPDGHKETRAIAGLDESRAFTYAIDDIKTRWRFYRERYERAQGR